MGLNDLQWWLTALFGSLMMCGAKLAYQLFGIPVDPPTHPESLKSWERKRRWLCISELAALPAFASIAVLIGRVQKWPVEGVVLLSMILGALGFAFFLDAIQTIIRRRLEMDNGNNV